MRTRCLVLINTVLGGSHGRIMSDLQQAAAAEGFHAYVAFARGNAEKDASRIRIGGKADVYLHGVASRLFDQQGFASKRATLALVKKLAEIQPSLIHLHNLHGYYLHLPTLFDYLKVANAKVVWTLHDCWALTGHCSHFVRANCDRWKTGCHHCPLKREYPASLLLDASRSNYARKKALFQGVKDLTVVTPSQWLAEVVQESFLKEYPLRVIPNGIDLSLFSMDARDGGVRARYGIPETLPMLLSVAAPFDARKGYDDLLRLAQRLSGRAHLVLVGLNEKQVKALPPGITGIQRTENSRMLAALYAAADVFVNTTYEDTYPTVNMEAMACGTPVVCHRVGGATEQITTECGELVPVGDTDALADAVTCVLTRGKASYQAACRAHAVAHFDRKQSIAQYLACYRALLEE